ncbi:unnamed protein product, partial [Enterobius vermicularis]|uniref:Transmembrane protein n=1 Tax=Enterobius vermicularis TaxID=51028 RepID=A0A0N4VG13_ENTVE
LLKQSLSSRAEEDELSALRNRTEDVPNQSLSNRTEDDGLPVLHNKNEVSADDRFSDASVVEVRVVRGRETRKSSAQQSSKSVANEMTELRKSVEDFSGHRLLGRSNGNAVRSGVEGSSGRSDNSIMSIERNCCPSFAIMGVSIFPAAFALVGLMVAYHVF